MINEGFKLSGKLTLALYNAEGDLTLFREVQNLIVQVGKNFSASALIAASVSPFTNIAVGTGFTAPSLTDTTLGVETGRTTFSSATLAANVATMTATIAAGVASGALQEAGIFNSNVAGVMLSRVIFPTVNKGAADSLVITWAITAG